MNSAANYDFVLKKRGFPRAGRSKHVSSSTLPRMKQKGLKIAKGIFWIVKALPWRSSGDWALMGHQNSAMPLMSLPVNRRLKTKAGCFACARVPDGATTSLTYRSSGPRFHHFALMLFCVWFVEWLYCGSWWPWLMINQNTHIEPLLPDHTWSISWTFIKDIRRPDTWNRLGVITWTDTQGQSAGDTKLDLFLYARSRVVFYDWRAKDRSGDISTAQSDPTTTDFWCHLIFSLTLLSHALVLYVLL